MPISISSNTITFNDLTTQTTSAFGTGVIGNTQLANLAVTSAKLADNAVTAAKLGTNERLQLCKAFVNFNGTTATPSTIRSSFNVSSITRNGTGDYTINFATPMADANYSVAGTASFADGVASYNNIALSPNRVVTSPLSTANCRISTGSIVSPQQLDAALVSVQIFGN